MYTRLTGSLLLILLLLLSGLPLAAQEVALLQKAEVMIVRPDNAAPAFVCAEEDCERLALLPAGAGVAVIAQVEGRTLEDSRLWYEVLLDCPCFDYERRELEDPPYTKESGTTSRTTWRSWHPYWSPDSTHIATVDVIDLYVWDATSGERLVKEPLDIFHSNDMAWSPDGTRIVAGGGVRLEEGNEPRYEPERNLLVVGADGRFPALLTGQDKGVWHVAWSHDGTRIAAAGDELRIWDAQQGASLVTIDVSASIVDWSPDDTRLVTSSHEGGLRVWEAASGKLLNSLGGDDFDHISDVAWSPDGTRIAYTSYEVMERESDSGLITGSALNIWDGSDRNSPVPLFESQDWISDLDWSPGSRFLVASIRGGVQVLDAGDGHIVASLIPELKPYSGELEEAIYLIEHVDWSPDGRRIAASGISSGMGLSEMRSAALVWDLTLIPEGRAHAFIHSSQLERTTSGNG